MFEKLLPLAVLAPVTGLIAVMWWRQTILFVLVFVVFEGAFRKWVFPGYQAQIYLLKDAMLLAAYAGFVLRGMPARVHVPMVRTLKVLAFALTLFCLMQLANPNSPSLIVSIVGLKNYLIYVPLAFILPYMIASKEQLLKYINAYMVIGCSVALLGLYQFTQPPESWINTYVSHEEGATAFVARFGGSDVYKYGFARTSGTFSYIGGFVTFLMLMFLLAASRVIANRFSLRGSMIAYATLTLAVGAMFTTGSRTPILAVALAAPALMTVMTLKGMLDYGTFFRLLAACIGLGIVVNFSAGAAVDALAYRAANSDNPITRLLSPIVETYNAISTQPAIGLGLGVTAASAIILMGSDVAYWLGPYRFELESARVVQETGVLGLVLVYSLRLYVMWLVVRAIRVLRDPDFVGLAAAVLVFLGIHLILFVINNPTAGVYYWTGIGLVFSMVHLTYGVRSAERTNAESTHAAQGLAGQRA